MVNIKDTVIKARQGDIDAFTNLYELYAKDLYRFAYYYLGSKELAQDAVQEAVCSAFKSIGGLRNEEAFKSWLFKILSVCCSRQIGYKKNQLYILPITDSDELKSSNESDMSLAIELKDAIKSLQEDDRSIVLLCVVCGYKSREVAEVLNMPAGTVRSKLSRALKRLRTELEKE